MSDKKIYIDVDILLQIIKDFRNTSKGNEDGFSGFDDLYFNIVGTASNAKVQNVTFSVTLPDASAVKDWKVYTGVSGSATQLEGASVVGNEIKLTTPVNLDAGEGITLRTVYDDGYFDVKNY